MMGLMSGGVAESSFLVGVQPAWFDLHGKDIGRQIYVRDIEPWWALDLDLV
jgi:hypothetical protein